ncbi:protein NRT1/ PTR FAMILY 5.10-like [Miscanthus floridulus]|uniref:protein NRT1/ PTR FAMILY 5.10-like n=1 Tax=Miscanthus floridulus TaxID=154761 RepID=UPI00345A10D0
MASDSGPASSDPLLPGRRAPSTGGWRSALFIIWVEVAERFAYYGISSNLISYLTGPLGQTTAAAAAAVNAWSGAASMLPLLGAAVADSWLGRYRTIVASSVLYITGLGMLTLSSIFSSPQQCRDSADGCSTSSLQTAFFYVSLYLVAIAQSGHKPCVQAFGADQFDATDPDESVSRATFFNWWYMGLCTSATVTIALMSYVQDNVGWALGFGVPSMAMLLALAVFLLGTRTYRFYGSRGSNGGGASASTFSLVRKAFVAWRKKRSHEAGSVELGHGDELPQDAVLAEEVKGLARLFPIWATCLLYGVVFAQPPTLFTKQAATLDRRVGQSFQIPPAALQCFLGASIVTCIVLYDRFLVPVARGVTGVASGITMLQRIGTGIALSLVTLVVAAVVEMKRLRVARDAGGGLVVVDVDGSGTSAVPMSLWWIVPQYVLLGAADVFTMVGMQEFFYDQVPGALKSLGLALYLSVLGVGSFISSFLITVIDGVTTRNGGTSWFADDLNRGHLDYFYLLLAALTALELLAFAYFSTSYVYKRKAGNH